jgi:hypothetical protein
VFKSLNCNIRLLYLMVTVNYKTNYIPTRVIIYLFLAPKKQHLNIQFCCYKNRLFISALDHIKPRLRRGFHHHFCQVTSAYATREMRKTLSSTWNGCAVRKESQAIKQTRHTHGARGCDGEHNGKWDGIKNACTERDTTHTQTGLCMDEEF